MDTWFELGIESWTLYFYIAQVIELYMSIWVPVAVVALLVARKIYKYKKDEVKIQPLLGVASHKDYKPGSRKVDL